ncbi:hypothetical protein K469DRAFT_718871 [Zopfia rhizophila CBS 207.26]|uniref:Uncharacterized protein n=1 Tax=Zopfia rhizophila CBS 207.26 TaxID=1314779 RepID=A0A6A6EM63_9PEZI|nr:hypothetical protein K469DRAFT_718871 [Zopfia rhizophila CBS 207.26]
MWNAEFAASPESVVFSSTLCLQCYRGKSLPRVDLFLERNPDDNTLQYFQKLEGGFCWAHPTASIQSSISVRAHKSLQVRCGNERKPLFVLRPLALCERASDGLREDQNSRQKSVILIHLEKHWSEYMPVVINQAQVDKRSLSRTHSYRNFNGPSYSQEIFDTSLHK